MATCGLISANITDVCDNVVGGVESTLYIANFDQWASWGKDYASGSVTAITALSLNTNENIYKIEMPASNNVRPKTDIVSTEAGVKMFKNTVSFVVSKSGYEAWAKIESLIKGRYVVFAVTNNSTIEIFGGQTGLISVDQTLQDAYAQGGLATITLSNADETPESHPKLFFVGATPFSFATALATFKSYIAA